MYPNKIYLNKYMTNRFCIPCNFTLNIFPHHSLICEGKRQQNVSDKFSNNSISFIFILANVAFVIDNTFERLRH